ncbi:MAG: 30S ribosomal protein S8e [Candidatus Bathyarchaeia archaeon]
MAWHSDLHKRKPTGGRSRPWRGKRKFEQGGPPTQTKLGDPSLVIRRARGGGAKLRLLSSYMAQVSDRVAGITRKAKILRVIKNPSNAEYDRRGVITKGALIETELGTAKVTSRPGQHGVINAILVEAGRKTQS